MTGRRSALHQVLVLKAWLVSVVAALIGLGLVVVQGWAAPPLSPVLDGLGIAAMTTGLGGLGYEFWLRSSAQMNMLELAGLAGSVHRAGIVDVTRWSEVDLREFLLEESGDIDVFVSYGRTVAHTYADSVMKSAAAQRRRVTVTALGRESPDHLKMPTRKPSRPPSRSWRTGSPTRGGSGRTQHRGTARRTSSRSRGSTCCCPSPSTESAWRCGSSSTRPAGAGWEATSQPSAAVGPARTTACTIGS
jgi:hypothetical protein